MPEEATNQPISQPLTVGVLDMFGKEALVEGTQIDGVQQETPAQEAPTTESTVQETPVQPATEQTQTDWFQEFQKEYPDIKSKDDIKEYLSSLNEFQEYKGKKGYYTELETTLQQVVDQATQLYGSKENFAKSYISEQLAKDGRDATVVSRIVNSEVGKLSDVEAMVLQLQYMTPMLANKPDIVVKGVLKEYGVDIDAPDFNADNVEITDPQQMVKFAKDAAAAKKYLNDLVSGIQVPEIKDFKAEIQAKVEQNKQAEVQRQEKLKRLSEDWTGKANELVNQLKSIEFKRKDKDGKEDTVFTYDVPQEAIKNLVPFITEYALSNNLDVTQDNVLRVAKELEQFVKEERMEEIMEARVSHALSKYKSELDNKVSNNKPINQTEAPADHAKTYEDEINEQFKRAHGLK
jgi:hypothetical protein